ncbi:MAG: CinA family protein [Tateyamaria sp.]|uniref:CinA family protein n=1 Tax=Tateyamaria sp. TaxID=1929288 RepID=UPI00329CB5B9
MTLAARIVELAAKSGTIVTAAESCTGGLVAAALTDIPGSSAAFERGFITYSNDAKIEMLGVTEASLDAFGAVSTQVAAEMATGALTHSKAHIAVSITGIAGPGGSEYKPEGRVCFAMADASGVLSEETIEFGALGRNNVRLAARDHALECLLSALKKR